MTSLRPLSGIFKDSEPLQGREKSLKVVKSQSGIINLGERIKGLFIINDSLSLGYLEVTIMTSSLIPSLGRVFEDLLVSFRINYRLF